MTRLAVTSDAEADLNEILDYLHREASSRIAADYGDRFRHYIERLIEFPGIGSPRPALGPHTRVGLVAPYLLVYDYSTPDDTLTLLRILHGKRDVARLLLRRS